MSATDPSVLPPSATPAPNNAEDRLALRGQRIDWLFRGVTLLFAQSATALVLGIAIMLLIVSTPGIRHSGWSFLTTAIWDPVAPDAQKRAGFLFGALPFLYGTLVTSALALLIAVPLGVGAAVFLAEIAPRRLSAPISFMIEMLAAVPSIVYGYWALIYLVPVLQSSLDPWLSWRLGRIPLFTPAPNNVSGQSLFAAGLVLALMVLPFITAVSRDVLASVPAAQREAAYGLGATKWEAIRTVVLRYANSGIIGAVMLGLGRAIGETMAVTLLIGSAKNLPHWGDPASFSLFRTGYTMTAILVDEYQGASAPVHIASLTEIALTLFLVTVIVNALARGLVWLTALQSGASGGETAQKARGAVGSLLRYGLIVLVILALAYQIFGDLQRSGLAGLTGGATWVALVLIALAAVNRWAPGRPVFITWRRICNGWGLTLCFLCAVAACSALALLLFFVAKSGCSALNAQFFRFPNETNPDAGGMMHAILGTVELVGLASLLGVPLGILGGIYLAEYGNHRLGFWTRFAADLMSGVPSIVIGIFAAALITRTTHGNIGLAGAFALGVMMVPVVMRTTEELIRLVPQTLREGSLALGATQARTLGRVILPVARTGIVTGVLLAVARIAGETAPLLMVGCNSDFFNLDPRGSLASLPMQIYVLRDAGTDLARRQSWGVALVLMLLVLVTNLSARLLTRSRVAAK